MNLTAEWIEKAEKDWRVAIRESRPRVAPTFNPSCIHSSGREDITPAHRRAVRGRRAAALIGRVRALTFTGCTAMALTGCTHTTLRNTLRVDAPTQLSAKVLRAAAEQAFPVGTPIDVVRDGLPPSKPAPAWVLWWPLDLWTWEEDPPGEAIVLRSSSYYLRGAWWFWEITFRFKDNRLEQVAVRDAGQAL